MANVKPTTADGGDRDLSRGQLILVGGIVVAFALVALVLLLNTVLYTENVATRGIGPAPNRAGDFATFTERSADRLVRAEERIEYATWEAARENATRGVHRIATATGPRRFQQHGALTGIDIVEVRRGAALVQTDGTRNFTAGGDNSSVTDWKLAKAGGIRNYTMTVNADDLVDLSVAGNFTLEIDGKNGVWRAQVYEVSGVVAVTTQGVTCTSDGATATIHWTAGRLGDCQFPFAVNDTGHALTPKYTIRYENGDNAKGTYHLVVTNKNGNGVVAGSFGSPKGNNPRKYPAVYSLVLQANYAASGIDYDTEVRVAPGEPPQTRPA